MQKTYFIFGKVISVNTVDSKEGIILHNELSVYPTLLDSDPDISINYVNKINEGDILSQNPGIHTVAADSFICVMGNARVKFIINNGSVTQIDFSITKSSSKNSFIQKWKSIQFSSIYESIGQIFHELVLVPFSFMIEDYSVIHSSGILNKNNEVVLFGGTGGVGKTSLELALCFDRKYKFFNDDIGVVDTNGNCYPNFSFPKIYAYNLEGNSKLKDKLFEKRSLIDRIHYKFKLRKGKKKARRRVNPVQFFGSTSNQPKKIGSYILLFREEVEKISIEKISAFNAAKLNSLIMSAEYNVFINQLIWQNYNLAALNRKNFIGVENLFESKTLNFKSALEKANNIMLARIPKDISNDAYKVEMLSLLEKHKII